MIDFYGIGIKCFRQMENLESMGAIKKAASPLKIKGCGFALCIRKRYRALPNRPSGRRRFCAVPAFRRRQNLGAGGIHFRRVFESPKGGAGQQPAKPKKKDTLFSVSFFLVEARGVEPLSENASTGTSPGADGYLQSLTQA